jgi:DNA-binding beta-propeller fold protein YncE
MSEQRAVVRDRRRADQGTAPSRSVVWTLGLALAVAVLAVLAANPAGAQDPAGSDRPFGRIAGLTLQAGEGALWASAIDPAGHHAYYVTRTSPGRVVKVDLRTFTRVETLVLGTGENEPWSIAIDPAGTFAYVGTGTNPGRLIKIDLTTFTRAGTLILNSGDSVLLSTVIDPTGRYAYLGTDTSPGRVIKIDLTTFGRVGTMTLATGENALGSAVIDPAGRYAYFGTYTAPGRIVKVDLTTFTRVGALTLAAGENDLLEAAVVDPAGRYAYFGTYTAPSRIVKVDLATFTRVGALALPNDNSLTSAVIDRAGRFAYFGTYTAPGRVVKVDLATFKRLDGLTLRSGEDGLTSAVIDPSGHFAYFGTYTPTARVIKVAIGPPVAHQAPRLATTYATRTGWKPHLLADVDGDGRDDLLSYYPSRGVWWATSADADGRFGASRRLMTYTNPSGLGSHLAADVTADGRAELLAYRPSDGTWWMSRARADGTYRAPTRMTTYGTRTGWQTHLAADMTGNGRADLLSYHAASGRWWMTESRSDGTFAAPRRITTYPAASGWQAHLAADVTGNGRADLLSYFEPQGLWVITSSRADGVFQEMQVLTNYATRTGWQTHLAVDLSGKGRADLVSYHPGSGRWWVTRSRADGGFDPPRRLATYATASGWEAHLAGDVSGNGRAEVLSYHPSNGRWWMTSSVPVG